MKTRKAGDDAECQLVGSTRRTTAFCPATISTLIPFIDHFAWTCPRMTYDTFGAIGPPCVSVSRIVVGGVSVALLGATSENMLNLYFDDRTKQFGPSDDELCPCCSGFGSVHCALCISRGFVFITGTSIERQCPVCKGEKRERCRRCAGTGKSGMKKTQ